MNTMTWLLKREFWEHKGAFFWAPAIVGMLIVALTGIAVVYGMSDGASLSPGVGGHMRNIQAMADSMAVQDRERLVLALSAICTGAGLPLMMMLTVTTFFYCIGALHDERRDRSILFWKSLPLSDTRTVLSKVLMATVGAPLIVIGISLLTSFALVLIAGSAAMFHGTNVLGAILGNRAVYMLPLQALGVLPVYMLHALPTVGWLLMVSSWVRSKPLLWGLGMPLVALVLVNWVGYARGGESRLVWLFNTMARQMLTGLAPGSWLFDQGHGNRIFLEPGTDPLLQAWSTLAGPAVWTGAAGGVLMICVAIRLRRLDDEG